MVSFVAHVHSAMPHLLIAYSMSIGENVKGKKGRALILSPFWQGLNAYKEDISRAEFKPIAELNEVFATHLASNKMINDAMSQRASVLPSSLANITVVPMLRSALDASPSTVQPNLIVEQNIVDIE